MVLNDLEIAVIKKTLELENIECPSNLNVAEVIDRDSSPGGFMTWVKPSQVLIPNFRGNFTGGRAEATINENILAGFVIYIKKGYLDVIEGYTFEEDWPNKIENFKVF